MIIAYIFFAVFTFFLFITNFSLIIRAWVTHKDDEWINEDKPLVSVLVPAYNESVGITDSVKSLLNQDYENFEIIIIDDGSSDDTYKKSVKNFGDNKKVRVFTQPNDGKGMALNLGVSKSKGEYLMCIDADTILVPHAISTMVGKKKEGVDAVAAMVGINNEYIMENGQPKEAFVPKKISTRMQWMEYARSYVTFRCSMKDKNVITVISGACGLISREMLDKTGGYKKGQLGEDMELTLNIHSCGGTVQFISETLAWTEAPKDIAGLGSQRVRWFRGAIQALIAQSNLMFRRDNSLFSWILLPYIWITDVFGVWVEVGAWLTLIYALVSGQYIEWNTFFFIWIAIMSGHYLNTILVLLFVRVKLEVKYKNTGRALRMGLFEGVTYHFLYLYWLLKSHIQQIFNASKNWNKLERTGLKQTT